MSQKEKHILSMYLKAVKRLERGGQSVTVGEVSRELGVSRNTAKKYLAKLVETGLIYQTKWDPLNGINAHTFATA